jgi:hypothetical protein
MTINIQQSIFSELADFIVSQPTLDEIAAYHVPQSIQQQIDNWLEKNREQGLTLEEREQMDKIMAISHLMTLAKAKARLKLDNKA